MAEQDNIHVPCQKWRFYVSFSRDFMHKYGEQRRKEFILGHI